MIAIDGLDVPKRCIDCKLCGYHRCIANGRDIVNTHERPDWCPVHEVGHLRKVIVIRKEYDDIGLKYAKEHAKKDFADYIGKIMNCKKCEHLDEYYQPMDDLIEYHFDLHVVDLTGDLIRQSFGLPPSPSGKA